MGCCRIEINLVLFPVLKINFELRGKNEKHFVKDCFNLMSESGMATEVRIDKGL